MEAHNQTTTMSQSKLFLNRIFAITFVILILMCLRGVITMYGPTSGVQLLTDALGSRLLAIILFYITIMIGLLIILIGLFAEIWKPSLDFTLNKDKTWRLMSIILFAVFVLFNVCHWVVWSGDLLGQGWQKIGVFLIGGVSVDTSLLSLMFGILFLTLSTPKKSLSYKIILFGVLCHEILMFFSIPAVMATGAPGTGIFQPWFWLDHISQIVILIGALRLLKMGWKKLILMIFVLYCLFNLQAAIVFSRMH